MLVPYGWGVVLFNLGIPVYATRAAARGDRSELGALIGTLFVASLLLGALGIVVGYPLASVLARHDAEVHRFILIGLFILPLGLVNGVAYSIANGLESWTRLNVARVTPPVTTVVTYLVLLLVGRVTVTTAILAAYGGGLLASVPLFGLVRRATPLSVNFNLLRRAAAFGSRAWVGTLASNANNRLDQLIMIPLVPARQLGLYAVAVNVSALDAFAVTAINAVVGPSVARGDLALLARAVRVTIFIDGAFGVGFALVAPVLLPVVFGSRFSPAIPMTWVLLAASVPSAAVWVLGAGLQNGGHPSIPAIGELVGVAVTVASLILLLPPLGGLGAAIASGLAYTTNSIIQIGFARIRLGMPLADMLILKRADVDFVVSAFRSRFRTPSSPL